MEKNENGQVLLIVVLVMIIALTIGLSLVSRSITSLRTSTEEVSAQKALSAAEAGIEQAIQSNASIANGSFSNDSATSFKTDITEVKGKDVLLNGGNAILQDEGVDLWLSDYSEDPLKIYGNPWSGNLTIYWGDNVSSCSSPTLPAALEIQVVYGNKTSPQVKRYAFDPCTKRAKQNNFNTNKVSTSTKVISGQTFYYSTLISISSGLIVRIIPLYMSSPLAVSGDSPLPSQGFVINSTGVSGESQRKINVFKGYPQLNVQNFPYGFFVPYVP